MKRRLFVSIVIFSVILFSSFSIQAKENEYLNLSSLENIECTDDTVSGDCYNEGDVIDEGKCGETAFWEVSYISDDAYLLRIYGKGKSEDYTYVDGTNSAPWGVYSNSITKVVVVNGITSIGSYSFAGLQQLSRVSITDTVIEICDGVFYDCDAIKSIQIPNSVENIGSSAFYKCVSLDTVILSNNIDEIKPYTFLGCSELKSISLPQKVITIGAYAFSGCSAIEKIDIPESVNLIDEGAFRLCKSLKKITIPGTVNSIGSGAFYSCYTLGTVVIEEGVKTIGEDAFHNCMELGRISIPDGCSITKSLGLYEDGHLRSIGPNGGRFNIIFGYKESIPNGILCKSLTDFTIPEGITDVYIPTDYASLYNAPTHNTTTISLPSTLKTLSINRSIVDVIYYNGTPEMWKEVKISGTYYSSKTIKKIHYNTSGVAGIQLNETECELFVGEKLKLSALVLPENAYDKDFSWYNSSNTVIQLYNGAITAKEPGEAIVTVESAVGGFTDTCRIVVKPLSTHASGVALNRNTLSLVEGEEFKLSESVMPQDADNKKVFWESEDTSIAQVDQTGNITAIESGETIITVTTSDGGYKAKCVVSVVKPPIYVTGVTLNKAFLVLEEGQTSTVSPIITPNDADNKAVVWSSSDTGIATVDANGKIQAKKEGQAVVKVKTVDGGYEATCNVEVKKQAVRVTGVSLNKSSLYLVEGESAELVETVFPKEADNKYVEWKSSDEDIVTVTDNGVVSAKKAGNTKVYVKTDDGDYEAFCEVIVAEKGSDWYKDYEYTFEAGNQIVLTRYIGNSKDLSISNRASMEGETYKVVLKGNVFKDNIDIESVELKEGVSIENGSNGESAVFSGCSMLRQITLPANLTNIPSGAFKDCISLEEIVIPDSVNTISDNAFDGCNKLEKITYKGEDLRIIGSNAFHVSTNEPLLTYLNSENERLIAYNWEDDNRELYKEVIPVESVSFKSTEVEMGIGETVVIEYTLSPENATNKSVKWSSSNESVVVVDDDGNIKALAEGTSIISVSTEDGDYTDSCTVTVYAAQYYSCVREGEQDADLGTINKPVSAWRTTSTRFERIGTEALKTEYQIRLEELYMGASAWKIICAESNQNKAAKDGQEWVLFKLFIKNTGNQVIKGDDIIKTNSNSISEGNTIFYDSYPLSLKIKSTAKFENERKDSYYKNVVLEPGQDSFCWVGICVEKFSGFPILKINNGRSEEGVYKYCYMNTNPDYKRKGEYEQDISPVIYGLYDYLKNDEDHEIYKNWHQKSYDGSDEYVTVEVKYDENYYDIDFFMLWQKVGNNNNSYFYNTSFSYDLDKNEYSNFDFSVADLSKKVLYNYSSEIKANEISPYEGKLEYDTDIFYANKPSIIRPDVDLSTLATAFIQLTCYYIDDLLKVNTEYNLRSIGFSKWSGSNLIGDKECTVSLIIYGAEYKTYKVNCGETFVPEIPKSGDSTRFIGWYLNGSKWDISSPVTEDITLVGMFIDDDTTKPDYSTALDSQPNFKGTEQNLTLVKGQKFTLGYGYWECGSKSNLSINSNNIATAKKATYSPIKLVHRLSGDTTTYNVSIVQPDIEKSFTIHVGDTETVWISNYGNLNMTWYSSSPDVASVDTNGKVYGISKGSSTISAYINGKSYNCKVKVLDGDNSKPDFRSSYPITLYPMQSTTVKANGFKPANASWSSDRTAVHYSRLGKNVVFEDDVVRITKTGKITAIGVGTSKLKAIGGGTNLEFTISVSEPVTQIVHLNKGTTKTLKIYGTKGSLPWKQSNSILEYTGNKIKGVVAGTTTLTANYENFEYKVIVYVEDPYITNSNVYGGASKYSITLKSGQTIVLTHRQVYQNIIYKSNKNDVAFIDEAGVLTARNKGKATVTGKVNGKKITINVIVE